MERSAGDPDARTPHRTVCIVLSSNSLPYSSLCLRSLLRNRLDPFRLVLITDEASDRDRLRAFVDEAGLAEEGVEIRVKAETDALAEAAFADRPNLRRFRDGHPCWLKITDPMLVSAPGDEVVVLDPDLFFPNPFRFEPSPETGILLMRQGPNCLYPPEAVAEGFAAGLRFADHVDIGVAQYRREALDLDVLEEILSRQPFEAYAGFMHIEAIVWAALAMRLGGGHLDPGAWFCWQRGYIKRLADALGAPGTQLLRLEPIGRVKCAHLSGRSKWWAVEAFERGIIRYGDRRLEAATGRLPFEEYATADFRRDRRMKRFAGTVSFGLIGG